MGRNADVPVERRLNRGLTPGPSRPERPPHVRVSERAARRPGRARRAYARWASPATTFTAAPDGGNSGALERRLIVFGFVLYVGVTSALLIVGGYFPSIDMLALGFFPIAMVMRRGRTFLADWVPFAIVLLAYEQFRGLAHQWNGKIHITDLIAAERLLFGTPVPTIRLQQWLHQPGQVGVFDVLATGLYFVHFVGVLALAFWLWLKAERRVYWRYVLAVIVLSYAGFATYALVPAMPPRLASAQGALPPLTDIFAYIVGEFSLFRPFFTVYRWIDPNPYAAMPSLHIAYPTLVFLVARRLWPQRWSWAFALYPVLMTFAVVYLGHHYIVDCVAGALYGWGALWLVWDAPRLARRFRVPWRSARREPTAFGEADAG
ncbi:MAG: phosphatase PAP2 family protein [Chloroflexi bacterium]|nr:phosphatase PAP2 family protein [Chloroflexota bacterium]